MGGRFLGWDDEEIKEIPEWCPLPDHQEPAPKEKGEQAP